MAVVGNTVDIMGFFLLFLLWNIRNVNNEKNHSNFDEGFLALLSAIKELKFGSNSIL